MHNAAVCGIADSVDMHAVLREREKWIMNMRKRLCGLAQYAFLAGCGRALGACADVPGLLKSL